MGLTEQMQYAKALAGANLLPKQYRSEPANLLLAMELGRSLGLPLAQILTGVNVVEGKPSLGAELMAALGRRAGHRIRVSGDDDQAVCSIWRSDDPDFEYRSVWTIQRAAEAKLCVLKDGRPQARSRDGKPLPWELFPASMLKARATSEACRMAIPDVLAGMAYVPEELQPQYVDADPEPRAVTATPKPVPAEPDVVEPTEQGTSAAANLDAADAEVYRADWLGRLDNALESGDLPLVQQLGSEAANTGHADLVDDARNAWAIIQGRTDDDQPPVEEPTAERRVDERPADWRKRW
jgi:hypothetical protein